MYFSLFVCFVLSFLLFLFVILCAFPISPPTPPAVERVGTIFDLRVFEVRGIGVQGARGSCWERISISFPFKSLQNRVYGDLSLSGLKPPKLEF